MCGFPSKESKKVFSTKAYDKFCIINIGRNGKRNGEVEFIPAYSERKILLYGLFHFQLILALSSAILSLGPRLTKRVPSESPTHGLSDGRGRVSICHLKALG